MATAEPLQGFPEPIDTTDDQDAVAANIRALMGRHRVSQARLAASVGLSTRGISERLSGKTNFTVRELGKIARFFEKSLGDIVTPLVLATLSGLYVTRNEHPPEDSLNIQGGAPTVTYFQQPLFIDVEVPECDAVTVEEPVERTVPHKEAA